MARGCGGGCLVAALLVAWRFSDSASALSCVCNKQTCVRPENCTAGRVPDVCGCCLECGRKVNQSCGGLHGLAGTCGSGLYCELSVELGSRIPALQSSDAAGVCRECKSHHEFGCNIFDGECECGFSCTRHFQHSSKAACEKSLLGSLQLNCNRAACPFPASIEPCPPDSYRPPVKQTGSSCCRQAQPCVCRQAIGSDWTCPAAPACASAELPIVVLPGTGTPGACCPLYRCVHRCVSPSSSRLYPAGSSWSESDCLTCECDSNGVSHCYTSMTCEVTCLNPRSVTGQCCPACDSESHPVETQVTEVGTKPATPVASSDCTNLTSAAASCSLQCVHGLMKDSNSCERCQCNPCPVLDCRGSDVDCLSNGGILVTDSLGCPTCQCHIYGNGTGPSSACFTSRGHSYSNGESWFDGCRQCYCHGGRERCALIYCPALPCSQPVLRPGHCCPSCSDTASAAAAPDVGFPAICFNRDHGSGRAASDENVWWLDACTSCLCRGGQALCESHQCAPALCERPHRLPGACCPTCPESGSATSAAPQVGQGSLDDGRMRGCSSSASSADSESPTLRRHGEVWRVSDCQVCTCQHGALHCYSQSCSPTAVTCGSGSIAILKKGQCCPECAADSWACIINDSQVVPHGSTWNEGCRLCSCQHGSLSCSPVPCNARQACPAGGRSDCCMHCSGDLLGDRSHVVSPLTIGLLATLGLFGVVIVILVVIVVRRTRHRGDELTAMPKILEMRAFNNSNASTGMPTDIACKPLMDKRPKSTNLEFLSIGTSHCAGVSPSRMAGECLKPLVDGSRNEYVHC